MVLSTHTKGLASLPVFLGGRELHIETFSELLELHAFKRRYATAAQWELALNWLVPAYEKQPCHRKGRRHEWK